MLGSIPNGAGPVVECSLSATKCRQVSISGNFTSLFQPEASSKGLIDAKSALQGANGISPISQQSHHLVATSSWKTW